MDSENLANGSTPDTRKVAILQSNYIPWKGYFDMIAAVDEFILFDVVQYTRRDWRNRNKIKTPNGTQWLTIPVQVKGKYLQKIEETEVDNTDWAVKHWNILQQNYKKAPYYNEIQEWLEPLYRNKYTNLSTLNRVFIENICTYLGIKTLITNASDYIISEGANERLLHLCQQARATDYISGPAARDYLDEALFETSQIKVHWFDYSGYPEYPQLWGTFAHEVSILDLLFNCGTQSPAYMKYVSNSK